MSKKFQFFFIFSFFTSAFSISSHPLVLVVSYDAFRYNYLDKGVTPTLARLQKEGCTTEYLENVFITKTFTNHASLATGLYPEVHGVLGNSLYDPDLKKKLEYGYELWHYNEKVVPIWIENERQGKGRHSGLMMWPGNEFNYTGLSATFHHPFSEAIDWEQRVDTALSWYMHPETPANLVMLYIEEPDSDGHRFGPDSPEVLTLLRKMDDITKYILKKLDAMNLREKMNLFLISDHGMEGVQKKDILDFRPYVEFDAYEMAEGSPTLHIFPKIGKAKTVYDGLVRAQKELGGFNVYRPNELLPQWHYAKNRRTPPILLVADPPHVFQDFYTNIAFYEKKFNITPTDNHTYGVHGYDNKLPNMRPYFIATGPAIKNRTRVPPFRTIDLYTVWATLLGYPEAGAKTNGSSIAAQNILKPAPHVAYSSIAAGLVGAVLVVTAMAITVYLMHRKMQTKYKYHTLLQADIPAHDSSRRRLLDSEEEEA